jgi:hypothetical protein
MADSTDEESALTDAPVCPHCGHVERDAWEIGFGTSEDTTTSCGSCGEDYFVGKYVSISYRTSKVRP